LREHGKTPNISASSKGISTSSTSSSRDGGEVLMKQAEERIGTEMFASFGATIDIATSTLTSSTVQSFDEGRIVACLFTKSQLEG